ncbi:MAG: hypothetical protein M1831_000484 [Alyxoria varia]|nr:MAG: hypothetical protein M1831_000484 [Alyxoria varia]
MFNTFPLKFLVICLLLLLFSFCLAESPRDPQTTINNWRAVFCPHKREFWPITAGVHKILVNPGWQRTQHSPPDSLNLIEFYGCSPAKAQVLKDAVVKLAPAAAYLRDALDSHSDKAHAASMLDAGFNGAFSKSFNKNDNIRIVHRTFDLMSRGLALNPCDEEQTARVQFACVDKTESGDVSTKGSADPRLALVSAFEEWWHARFDYENTLACASTLGKPFSRDLGHAANAAHEMAHLAGALGFPEAYHRYNMLRLTPEQAIYNAQHYARAILCMSSPSSPVPQSKP